MFLKQLYKHSRWYFVLVIFFIAGQLFINYKRGAVISPFYHYGMYSQVMNPERKYRVFEIFIDGQQLEGKNFTPWQWDKIIQPLVYYSSIAKNNKFYKEEVERIMTKTIFKPVERNFLQHCDYPSFIAWYKIYLSGIVSKSFKQVDLTVREYNFNGKLQPTDSIYLLKDLCR